MEAVADDVACDEIESAHPGYLGAQDTFYVVNLRGVGRFYQQTFIDPHRALLLSECAYFPSLQAHQMGLLSFVANQWKNIELCSCLSLHNSIARCCLKN